MDEKEKWPTKEDIEALFKDPVFLKKLNDCMELCAREAERRRQKSIPTWEDLHTPMTIQSFDSEE